MTRLWRRLRRNTRSEADWYAANPREWWGTWNPNR